ncbi:hypothetical protein O3M35_002469 [Rhynocoris fuscipes]|uniref:Uncharacterized protein n=1 Tax=Rhynocoris fuscipes TaxID=488301 RepID=A0AAW1CKE7_9HEMI
MMKNAVVKPRPTGVKSDLQFVRPQRYESPYLQPLNNRIKQQKQKLAKPKGRRKLRGISSASSNSLNQKLLAFPDTGGSGDCKAEKFTQKFLDENLHNIYKLIVENKGRLSGVNNWQQKLVQNLNKTTDTEKMADQGETPPEHPRGSRISQLKNLIPRRSNRASNPSSNAGETGGATNAAEGGAAGGNEDRTVAVRGNEDRTVGRGAEGGNEGGEGTVPVEAGIGGNVAGEAARDATGGAAGEVPGEVAADATGGTPADAAGGAPVAVAAGAPADADAARDLAELPTAQSNIMNELREADAKAQRTAQIIEAMKEELAALAKKDKMTPDDAKMIERKQAELMEKLSEFEQITTQVQQLVGLTDITSKVIIEQKLAQRRLQAQDPIPEESLPKVIVCGGGGIDPVPKIIVCEPTNRQGCGQPLYQQLSGRSRRSQNQQAPCKKKMTSDCPPQQIMSGFQPPQQQSWGYGGNAAAGCTGGGGGIMGGPWSAGYNQVFPVGPMGAWPPPHISVTPSAHSTCQEDSINPMVIKISTPVTCSPTSSTINVDQETAGDAKNDDEKEGEPKVPTKEELEKKKCDALATKASDLQKEVQALNEENKELKKVLGVGKTVTLCKNEIAKEQVCKADILRQIGVPLPKSYVQGECCRAYQVTLYMMLWDYNFSILLVTYQNQN